MTALAFIAIYAPLAGAILAGIMRRPGKDETALYLATASVVISALCSCLLFFGRIFADGDHVDHTIIIARWLDVGALQADWAIRVDSLSITMMFVVGIVSALVHIYSFSYMRKDPAKGVFFAYLSLFTFAMLMLISANDFLQLFFGWEGVGLASYLLIGFWYRKQSAGLAAVKAFVTNRVGDAGFILGILTIFTCFGSIGFEPVFNAIKDNALVTPMAFGQSAPAREVVLSVFGVQARALELAGLLLLVGAMGKSAQFLLHVWLPDAMEGPTPVSALIHAATMVTAGVFMLCRCSVIYEYAPVAAAAVTIIGAITALFAASIALVQNDIKRVIAYSTCSQLGYMFFAAGLGAYSAAMFHLFTHAFFKALLFLSAGAVIHGFMHEQDMRKMGGLSIKMPFIWLMTLIGTLALTGIGIPGTVLGFAGFFSKDAIIEAAFMHGGALGMFAFVSGLLTAGLTSFYSWRLIMMVFHGESAAEWSRFEQAHDAPSIMRYTLMVLAAGAVFSGVVGYGLFIDPHSNFWGDAIHIANSAHSDGHEPHHPPQWVLWAPLLLSLLGFVVAILLYRRPARQQDKTAKPPGILYLLLSNKYYFDHLYQLLFVRGVARLGDLLSGFGDRTIIDGGGPNGMAALARSGSRQLSRLHTGFVFHYAMIILLAVAVFGAMAIMAMGS